MYYYRKRRKKSNVSHTKPVIDMPLNDVWESYQEKKSYKDFEISDEAFAFFSNREKYKQVIANNQYWKDKNQKIGKYILASFALWIVSLFISFGLEKLVLFIIPAVLFLIWLVLTIISFVYEHKIVNSFDNYEWKYDNYMKYLEKYCKKKTNI